MNQSKQIAYDYFSCETLDLYAHGHIWIVENDDSSIYVEHKSYESALKYYDSIH